MLLKTIIVFSFSAALCAVPYLAHASGPLKCYSGKDGGGRMLYKAHSTHNCCNGLGSSWSCPTYNDGEPVGGEL